MWMMEVDLRSREKEKRTLHWFVRGKQQKGFIYGVPDRVEFAVWYFIFYIFLFTHTVQISPYKQNERIEFMRLEELKEPSLSSVELSLLSGIQRVKNSLIHHGSNSFRTCFIGGVMTTVWTGFSYYSFSHSLIGNPSDVSITLILHSLSLLPSLSAHSSFAIRVVMVALCSRSFFIISPLSILGYWPMLGFLEVVGSAPSEFSSWTRTGLCTCYISCLFIQYKEWICGRVWFWDVYCFHFITTWFPLSSILYPHIAGDVYDHTVNRVTINESVNEGDEWSMEVDLQSREKEKRTLHWFVRGKQQKGSINRLPDNVQFGVWYFSFISFLFLFFFSFCSVSILFTHIYSDMHILYTW